MTNGEKIQTILDVDRDCTEVHGENGTMTFTVTQNFWNAEYKEPTTKDDLGVDVLEEIREEINEIEIPEDYMQSAECFAFCDALKLVEGILDKKISELEDKK